ncbi:MAG: GNAT family N-acetyltransferase [Ignavibacteriaceae bacterium]|nr:GNAT family N-acetyltransferase [Ignavibacteriaceae bacterium]
MKLVFVESEKHLTSIRELFLEYAESLGFSLCFQDFDKELANLPGDYSPPDGRLILALDENKPIGCVALRKLEKDICEMKRLYVKPEMRGIGLGKQLVQKIIDEALKIGYVKMRLDTVPKMKEAIDLYHKIGFKEVEPYRENPIEGALYMEKDLHS